MSPASAIAKEGTSAAATANATNVFFMVSSPIKI
jgi:hypothetical protein